MPVVSANHEQAMNVEITSREGCCRERHPRKARENWGLEL
jgi:hypothetical protein